MLWATQLKARMIKEGKIKDVIPQSVGCFDRVSFIPSFLFLLQNVVPDLSYSVRSPALDKWEGIKQLKAALWALVSIHNSVMISI